MTVVATQHIGLAGTPPTFAAAGAGETYEVGVGCKLIVKNGSGSTITVTVAYPGNAINGIANPDTVYSILAGAEAWIPLYDFYADPSDRRAHITYSSTTTVTRAGVKG